MVSRTTNSKEKQIEPCDFMRMFKSNNEQLPSEVLTGIDRISTCYGEADKENLSEYVLHVLRLINEPAIARTTSENLQAWQKGWNENLQLIVDGEINFENLKPRYFRGSKFFRYDNKLVMPENKDIEYDLFVLARHIIFSKYLAEYKTIYELGCGSCQNLLMLSKMFPSKNLLGLDWVEPSMKIANKLAEVLPANIRGILFDMLNPSADIVLEPDSAVITIHALEQIGTQYDKLLSFILAAKPAIVLHYEPIIEFYDEDNLIDYLAIMYSQKRMYLSGYLTALRRLQEEGKIEILEAYRPYLGGVIHEASIVLWKPL